MDANNHLSGHNSPQDNSTEANRQSIVELTAGTQRIAPIRRLVDYLTFRRLTLICVGAEIVVDNYFRAVRRGG